jgi:hypothetical protein
LGGQNENNIYVLASGKYTETVDRSSAKLGCHLMRAMRYLIADGSQLKPIGKHPQGRGMAMMPEITQPN